MGIESQFAKYQEIEVDVTRPKTDRRPESLAPVAGTISLGRQLGTSHSWADHRQLVEHLLEANMCDLVEANRSGSGTDTPSLAVVRPAEAPTLEITPRDGDQLAKWTRRAKGAAARMSLFDDPATSKPDFEVVPWRFRYHYRCRVAGCAGHEQTIVDWEVVALWRRVRHRPNWQELMTQKFEQELWSDRAAVLFAGNQEQHPAAFLVLGVFWPPATGYQPRLGL